MTYLVRPVCGSDREDWRRLYDAYARFYKVTTGDAVAGAVWSWLHDPDHPLNGLVAADGGGGLVGLCHYRPMPSPLRGRDIGFIDDLFVDPSRRGGGIGAALIDRVVAVAREEGWPKVRWITAEDNARARALYDRVAGLTAWRTYEISP